METVDSAPTTIVPPAPARPRRRSRWIGVAGMVCLGVVLFDVWLVRAYAGIHPAVSASTVTVIVSSSSTPPTAAATTAAPTPSSSSTFVTVTDAWVSAVATRTGIPARAVRAYADAQLTATGQQPGCHISWAMLAGIGAVESSHGTAGGSMLTADGLTSITILGPALDGTHGNTAIPATTAGRRLDGDPRWDHAVGPMQFIPSTWTRWGTSASGQPPNPNNIDDAALTAARYLCAAGGDLATLNGWQAALSAYNAPAAYAIRVTAFATTYATESQTG